MKANLPLSRIRGTQLSLNQRDEMVFHDSGYNEDLFVLSDELRPGDIAAIIKIHDDDIDDDVLKVMQIKSPYLLSSLNRESTKRAIRDRLREVDFELIDVGYFYKLDGVEFVHKQRIKTKIDHETDERLCEILTKKPRYDRNSGMVLF